MEEGEFGFKIGDTSFWIWTTEQLGETRERFVDYLAWVAVSWNAGTRTLSQKQQAQARAERGAP